MVLATIFPLNILPTTGVLDTIFHKSWLALSIVGVPGNCNPGPVGSTGCGGYAVTLIELIILAILATAATGITERLTGAKPGGLLAGVLLTLIGAFLFAAYVKLPFEIVLEGVRLIAALLGAIIVAVFYVLLRKQFSAAKKG